MEIRTHTCGELNREHIGKSVILNGWINTVRLHGQVVFIDLRDRYGKTQIVFNSENYSGDFELVKKLSLEDVLSISGSVQNREEEAINTDMNTGEIEVAALEMEIINEADVFLTGDIFWKCFADSDAVKFKTSDIDLFLNFISNASLL